MMLFLLLNNNMILNLWKTMMKVRNLGKKSLDEVTNKLHALGLDFAREDD